MRIHGIQLRGLSSPAGEHQLALDPGYTVLRVSEPGGARRLLGLTRALLHPESARAMQLDSRGRVVVTLALRSDGCLIAADFARGRISLGRLEAGGGASRAISSDAHEIEAHLQSQGLPGADEFDLLHVFGAAVRGGTGTSELCRAPIHPPVVRIPKPGPSPDEAAERIAAERTRLLAEHAQRVSALARERSRLEADLGVAIRSAAIDRVRDETRLRELQAREAELSALESERDASQAELEKSSALADSGEDLDARLQAFRTLASQHSEERAVVEDSRSDLLADRARLRVVPRRLLVPISLGLALGVAGAAAGAVGYPVGYALAAAGILALVVSLVAARIVRAKLARIDTLLAVLRVRERTSERRFETEGAQVRGIMLALGVGSPEELKAAASGVAEKLHAAEALRRRIASLEESYPAELRAERTRLERALRDGEESPVVRAARAVLDACPTDVPVPALPEVPAPVADEHPSLDSDTAVDLSRKPDEDPEPAPDGPGPEILISAAARVLDRSETEIRARLGPILPVYLRALSMGIFTNARPGEAGTWILRGAGRDEQPFMALPDRERELVRLAVQLALLEALAADRRIPLLIGPDLPARGEAEQRALARSFKRLASVVQVVQVVTASAPWAEHAGKTLEL